MAAPNDLNLLVIVGPTASGKTDLAIRLAKEWSGEVVCADSRTVYTHLDVATAKPTAAEQAVVPHHLLNVRGPGDPAYTAADFQADARAAIAAIRERDRLPIIVGGSGLYIDGLILDYDFADAPSPERRIQLQAMNLSELQQLAINEAVTIPAGSWQNPRHIARLIERGNRVVARKNVPDIGTRVFGLNPGRHALKERITRRTSNMFSNGLIADTQRAINLYGSEHPVLQSGIYEVIQRYIQGSINEHTAIEQCIDYDYKLSKKQLTWFRRHPYVSWFDSAEHAADTLLS